MRILHTSDWHIGRGFHGTNLLEDQATQLRHLAQIVADRQVDVVLVAGDVYDRSIPGADAVAVLQEGLRLLHEAGAVIIATSGNHDSPTRLGAGAVFSAYGGLHLLTELDQITCPVMLEDQFGPVACYGIPYLDPDVATHHFQLDGPSSHQQVLSHVMDSIRTDAAARGTTSRLRSIVLAHAFVQGGQASESERSLAVGGVDTVSAMVFSGVDYAALGHLHTPQTVEESVRYSGSLLPYSFGERRSQKSTWIVDLDADGVCAVTQCPLPTIRPLDILTDTVEQLLTDTQYEQFEQYYLAMRLTDERRPLDAMKRLQERFPYVLTLQWNPPEQNQSPHLATIHHKSDPEIIADFLRSVRGAPSAREMQWIEQAVKETT